MIRTEAWPFYRTSFGVRLWWELEELKGPKGPVSLNSRLGGSSNFESRFKSNDKEEDSFLGQWRGSGPSGCFQDQPGSGTSTDS